MKTSMLKQRFAHFLVVACLSAAPAALGQTLPAALPADSGPEFAWQKPLAQPPSLAQLPSAAQDRSQPVTFNPTPLSAEQQAAMKQSYALFVEAAADQHAGRYAQAEAEARESNSVDPQKGIARGILARALESQGRIQEALHVYLDSPFRISPMITEDADGVHGGMHEFLPYAWLQLNSGHWAQAVAAYNAALPFIGDVGPHPELPIIHDGDVIRANSHFSPDVPEPERLALMIHLARGAMYNGYTECTYETLNKEAFAEYGKALQLAPNSALANYYYGVGWTKLSPAEQQFGSIQQARAALTKAVHLAAGPLKVKAQKALMVALKTK